jgi:hypothetical protein
VLFVTALAFVMLPKQARGKNAWGLCWREGSKGLENTSRGRVDVNGSTYWRQFF